MDDSVLSKDELDDLEKLFNLVDVDGSGFIDRNELHALLTDIDVDISEKEEAVLFREIGAQHEAADEEEDVISMEDFVAFMSSGSIRSFEEFKVRDAFQKLAKDTDPPGLVSYNQLRRCVTSFIPEMDSDKATVLLDHIPVDKHGYMDYEKYIQSTIHRAQSAHARHRKTGSRLKKPQKRPRAKGLAANGS